MPSSHRPPSASKSVSARAAEAGHGGHSRPATRAAEGPAISADATFRPWIEMDLVPSWLRPFSLDENTRFTRTPDHLLRPRAPADETPPQPAVPPVDAGQDASQDAGQDGEDWSAADAWAPLAWRSFPPAPARPAPSPAAQRPWDAVAEAFPPRKARPHDPAPQDRTPEDSPPRASLPAGSFHGRPADAADLPAADLRPSPGDTGAAPGSVMAPSADDIAADPATFCPAAGTAEAAETSVAPWRDAPEHPVPDLTDDRPVVPSPTLPSETEAEAHALTVPASGINEPPAGPEPAEVTERAALVAPEPTPDLAAPDLAAPDASARDVPARDVPALDVPALDMPSAETLPPRIARLGRLIALGASFAPAPAADQDLQPADPAPGVLDATPPAECDGPAGVPALARPVASPPEAAGPGPEAMEAETNAEADAGMDVPATPHASATPAEPAEAAPEIPQAELDADAAPASPGLDAGEDAPGGDLHGAVLPAMASPVEGSAEDAGTPSAPLAPETGAGAEPAPAREEAPSLFTAMVRASFGWPLLFPAVHPPAAVPAPEAAPAASAPVASLPAAPPRAVWAPEDGSYELPALDLLAEPPPVEPAYELSEEFLDQNSVTLQQTLRDFGVRGEVIDANPGPVVTLYEFEPAPGTKSSRVIGLSADIARSMSAVSARVAVVEGRNVIGIELPNQRRETVWLREMLASHAFGEARAKLAIALGKTIGGEPVIADLARMPHLLVAGTTGSGKSVAINTMILSLIYRHAPEACRLIMIDPKMLELSVYEGIPHLLTPVVTDPKKAIIALKWAVKEMEDRYRKMSRLKVRNIDGFNARVAEALAAGEVLSVTVQTGFDRETGEAVMEQAELDLTPLPYIVIIVDEMADLMMVAGKEIEGAIQRLAQMARAAGIHLVMATQRPSVDVITGTIKANFPTRISFQVTSKIDSRTILGEMGAETLLGQGDMLYMASGGRITRVHGPFVSDPEVEAVVEHLKRQGHPDYLDAVTCDAEADGPLEDDEAVFDKSALAEDGADHYEQAVAIVMRDRKASTSYIQRRLQVGYNKAASLMERMETEGIVGPANHAGKREILTTRAP